MMQLKNTFKTTVKVRGSKNWLLKINDKKAATF